MTTEVKLHGTRQVEIARECVRSAHFRLHWQEGMKRSLDCGVNNSTLWVDTDDADALEAIADDAAKYYHARCKPSLAKAADAIRAALAECRISASFARSFETMAPTK